MHKIWFKMKDYKPLVMVEVYCFSDIEHELKEDHILDVPLTDPYRKIKKYIYIENVSTIIYKIEINRPYEKIYQKILQNSSIAPYLIFNSKEIKFEYTLDTSYKSVLFIGSLLRYLEESHSYIKEVLNSQEIIDIVNDSIFNKETADLLLAYISSKTYHSGHRVFTPNKAFAGDYPLFKEYISECLLNMEEVSSIYADLPSSFLQKRVRQKDPNICLYSGIDITFPSFAQFKNFIISGEIEDESPSPW